MDTKIILSILWVATMLTYLLGDVLRIFAGDYEKGKLSGKKVGQNTFTLVAALMVLPIVMAVLTLILERDVSRILNITLAGFFLLFNLIGLPSYKRYDQLLLVISLVFNALVIYYGSRTGLGTRSDFQLYSLVK